MVNQKATDQFSQFKNDFENKDFEFLFSRPFSKATEKTEKIMFFFGLAFY